MTWRASPGRSTTFGTPAAAAPPRARVPKRFYVGRRSETAEAYVVTSRKVERLRPRAHCADAAFDWASDAGPGAIELAFAILRDATRRRPPEPACVQFQADVLASVPWAGFVLGCDDVARWLAGESRGTRTWRRRWLTRGWRVPR
jgi:hypothetical protein